jgi:hypothetical protein
MADYAAVYREGKLITKYKLGFQAADEAGKAKHTRRIVKAIAAERAAARGK